MGNKEHRIQEENSLRKYRTEVPNSIVKGKMGQGLTVSVKWLYTYLKSVAGDNGICWQSTRIIADKSGLSMGTISAGKKELAKAELIDINVVKTRKGKAHHITINDVWLANMQEFSNDQHISTGSSVDEQDCSHDEKQSSENEQPRSANETKKNPFKKKPQEEEHAREKINIIYEAYPKQVGRRKAFQEIRLALERIEHREEIEDSFQWLKTKVNAFAKSPKAKEGKFIPNPANWFKDGRYDDNPTAWQNESKTEDNFHNRPEGVVFEDLEEAHERHGMQD